MDALEKALGEAIEAAQEEHARRQTRDPNLPALELPDVAVRLLEEGEEPGAALLGVTVREPTREGHARLSLADWGPAQAIALARRLAQASALPTNARVSLRGFAERLTEHPGWVDPVVERDLLIRWLAEVSQGSSPRSAEEARACLTRAAWRRACASEDGGPLHLFNESLLDQLFGRWLLRPRAMTEAGAWTRAPRGAALEMIEALLQEGIPDGSRATLLELVDIAAKPGRGRSERFEALRQAIAGPEPKRLLGALIRTGVLREARGATLEPTHPELAAAYAARALRDPAAFIQRPELLVDPHGAWFITELARHGVAWGAFVEATELVPAALAMDVCVARLRFAWASDTPPPDEDLIQCWAGTLWAAAHAVFARGCVGGWGFGCRGWRDLLRLCSERFRRQLPVLREDPIAELRAFVPEAVVDLVARWRRTPELGEPALPEQPKTYSEMDPFTQRRGLEANLYDLAPWQHHPAHFTELWQGGRWDVHDGRTLRRLEELAESGDTQALEFLAGTLYLEEVKEAGSFTRGPAEERWSALPGPVRLRWVLEVVPNGEDAWRLLQALLKALKPSDWRRQQGHPDHGAINAEHPCFTDLIHLGERVGVEIMEDVLAEMLLPGRSWSDDWLPRDLAWVLVERLELRRLLRDLVKAPAVLIPALRLGWNERRGVHVFWGRGEDQFEHLRPIWHGRRPSLHVDTLVESWMERAQRAAEILHRLGEPEPLELLWAGQLPPRLPSMLFDACLQLLGLLTALCEGRTGHYGDKMPTEVLAAVAPEDFDVTVETPLTAIHRDPLLNSVMRMPVSGWRAVTEDSAILRSVRRAFRGLEELIRLPMGAWPDEVCAWLRVRVHRPGALGWPRYDLMLHDQVWRSARALLDAGETGPVERWATGSHLQNGKPPPLETVTRANARAVQTWWVEDRRRLDAAWEVLRNAEPLLDKKEELEARLLREGSHLDGWREHAAVQPHCPRPFVIRHCLNDPVTAFYLHERNRRSEEWGVVLRAHYATAPARRTAAWWALRLGERSPESPELLDALMGWALDDPTPWSGPWSWSEPDEAGRLSGGQLELLEHLVQRPEAWATKGLLRLWEDGLARPWLSYGREEVPAAVEGWWLVDTVSPHIPTVVRLLADALCARGHDPEVVSRWPGPLPLQSAEHKRASPAQHLRAWLIEYARRHATSELLRSRLRTWLDDGGVPPIEEAWLLMARDCLEDRELLIELAEATDTPYLPVLARVAPERLPDAARRMVQEGEPERYTIWMVLGDTQGPDAVSPRAAVLAREMLMEVERA
ncbi:MAG: hypothetical protein H6739_08465 [Alphaproteobacteria bacterium]|nr:hypothetical protein [Alphaproteobacteria bacterium]